MDLNELVERAAEQRGLRESTKYNYRRMLHAAGITGNETRDELETKLLGIHNVNVRRTTAVAVRAVLGVPVRLPKGQIKAVILPTETELRFALMTTKYEVRGLLMAYAGLRLGEACAVTKHQLQNDRLLIDRQVLRFHTGNYKNEGRTVIRLAPPKTGEATIVVPFWLADMIKQIDGIDNPKNVSDALRRTGRRHGIVLNPHALRKYYATMLLDKGANMKLVSEQMRHSNISTTLKYYAQTNTEDIHRLLG